MYPILCKLDKLPERAHWPLEMKCIFGMKYESVNLVEMFYQRGGAGVHCYCVCALFRCYQNQVFVLHNTLTRNIKVPRKRCSCNTPLE